MLLQDLRIAVRHLRKSPGFAVTAVLMLALGIGATTAIFSIVEGVLLRPLPFPHSERLVTLGDILQGVNLGGDGGDQGVTSQDVGNYTRDTTAFEALGAYQQINYEMSGVGESAQINATRMTAGVFSALGVAPLMGRTFTVDEDMGSQLVAVVSYSMWQGTLHGDPQVLGSKIQLDRRPYTIIGVMPKSFEFPLVPGHVSNSVLWVPMSFTPQELGAAGFSNWNFNMIARLKPGMTSAQAQQDAQRVAEATMRSYPPYMASLHIQSSVHSLHEATVSDARGLVRILFLAIMVVLLIACANLAGLLLVRAIRRRREFAIRLALGAGAFTVLRQSVLESLVLSVSGGVLGLVLAAVGLRVGVSYLPETLPLISEIGLDWQVVFFALGLSVLTGLGCGLVPAFAASRTSVNETLKEGGRTGTPGGGHAWLRSALVVGEIATALVLLSAAGLLLRSFEKMRSVDLGYRPDHVLTAAYSLPAQQYPKQGPVNGFTNELMERLRSTPGVKSAGLSTFLPAAGSSSNSTFVVEGYVPPKGANMNLATLAMIEGDYLQSMGIPLLAGRFFTTSDTADRQLVAIVNHKFAEHYWRGTSPIGKRFRIATEESKTPWMVVVGEVADVKEGAPDYPDKEQWYEPLAQFEASLGAVGSPDTDVNGRAGYITLRTAFDPDQMANALRGVVKSIDPQLALTQVQSMETAVSESKAPRRFNTTIITAFAMAAVLLAVLGIYGVIAFSTALRVQEMAIRMALGSQKSGILRLVFISALKLAIAGCVIGLIGASLASRLLDSLLFEVSPFDPIVLTLASILVLLLALVASLIPARRAAAVEPMQALRAE